MNLFADLKQLFMKAAQAPYLDKLFKKAPPLELSSTENFFPPSVRHSYDGPLIPMSEFSSTVKAVPVVTRGGEPIPLTADAMKREWVEPLPIYVEFDVTGVDLNNLKLMGLGQKKAWVDRKILQLRTSVKMTIEILNSQAVYTGGINYPLLLANGTYDNYQVTYLGQSIHLVTVAAGDKWDAGTASLVAVYSLLGKMRNTISKAGRGGDVRHFAGSGAFAALLALCEATDKPKVSVKIKDKAIIVGGRKVELMEETYVNPQTGNIVPKVPENEIRTVAAGHAALVFGALDSLTAGLKALPFFPDIIEDRRGQKLSVTGMSKPLPVSVPESVARAIVL